MSDSSYTNHYRNVDFRKYPEKYKVGRGEQGVLIAEPYTSEILPHWKFATVDDAKKSSKKIYAMFLDYSNQDDFVGMDMARKFLQMGFTRARRYANHKSGKKYDLNGNVLPQLKDWKDSEKAQSAKIFYEYYTLAKNNDTYKRLKILHIKNSSRTIT